MLLQTDIVSYETWVEIVHRCLRFCVLCSKTDIFKMWKTNICTTLTRHSFNIGNIVRVLQPSIWNTTSTVRQFVGLSFYKTRTFYRYVFGRNLFNFNKANSIRISDSLSQNLIKKVPLSSRLCRVLIGQENIQVINKSKLRFINHRLVGSTLAFVGVCLRDENGLPILLNEKFHQKHIDLTSFYRSIESETFEFTKIREDINKTIHIQFKDYIAKGCCGAVYKAETKSKCDSGDQVAVKMLFNYDVDSNTYAIINSTLKECMPYNGTFSNVSVKRKVLPPHPNIIKILSVFADQFKPLKNSKKLFPQALPRRYGGYGHNKTLFIVQKLYDMDLRNYLGMFKCSENNSLMILTQCMSAIEFLSENNIAHRDLKLDNILVSLAPNNEAPWVVISDFGLSSISLRIPFQTEEVCRGGNRALMAPEIVTAQPSPNGVLDYSKADLWSLGTIAYEIFGAENPFCRTRRNSCKLDSYSYCDDDIPEFASKIPLLSTLIYRVLSRDPNNVSLSTFINDGQ